VSTERRLICVASTVLLAMVPAKVWGRVPRPIKTYLALVAGPWIGLHWYLGKLVACGYWTGMLDLYPTVPLSRASLDWMLPPSYPRTFLAHGVAMAIAMGFHLDPLADAEVLAASQEPARRDERPCQRSTSEPTSVMLL
jgi:hypothetical protein